MRARALQVLQTVFGYPAFRGAQADIIDVMAQGGDALVLMPTGGGKSLCYQIPALLREGCGVVISPLIALMQDQVDALDELGVRAAFLNSTQSFDEAMRVERALRKGELDLLYIAPERLLTPRCLELLESSRIALFAIDEAHCVSQWGHDFRPEYIRLSVLHERFPAVPRMALTATADFQTRAEIVERLQLRTAREFVSSFDRPNIRYQIVEKENGRRQLLDFIRSEHAGDAGIVYCLSRKKVEETAEFLNDNGLHALPYHAGMDNAIRSRHQSRFLREDGIVMVATIAFGMGIDKPDVRFVAHLDLPKSLEGYYQETGRAGRDGGEGKCIVFYSYKDIEKLEKFMNGKPVAEQEIGKQLLFETVSYAETSMCRRKVLLHYFGEDYIPDHCDDKCDNCSNPKPKIDAKEEILLLLQSVIDVKEKFKAKHVIQVLLGEENSTIKTYRHNEL